MNNYFSSLSSLSNYIYLTFISSTVSLYLSYSASNIVQQSMQNTTQLLIPLNVGGYRSASNTLKWLLQVTHVRTPVWMYGQMYTCTNAHMHTCIHKDMDARTHVQTYVLS